MLVGLARSGLGACVVEAQRIESLQAHPEGLEIRQVQRRLLIHVLPRHDQHVVGHDVVFVQQADVSG